MTIRGLVKKELVKRGYPIEISEWHKRKTHVRGLYSKSVKCEGVLLERTLSNKYQACMKRDDKIEMLTIHTNGYISEKEMNEIVEQCKKDYHPYHTELMVIIY